MFLQLNRPGPFNKDTFFLDGFNRLQTNLVKKALCTLAWVASRRDDCIWNITDLVVLTVSCLLLLIIRCNFKVWQRLTHFHTRVSPQYKDVLFWNHFWPCTEWTVAAINCDNRRWKKSVWLLLISRFTLADCCQWCISWLSICDSNTWRRFKSNMAKFFFLISCNT